VRMGRVRATVTPDLSIRALNEWAAAQSARLRAGLPAEAVAHPTYVLAQAAKLAEEVGELQAEVLGQAGYQRRTKGEFTTSSMGGELADVLICTAMLAASHGVDLGAAVATKIAEIEARHCD
jgi:NTP pyrophosphatase (non-canonical NTP hydrolase)